MRRRRGLPQTRPTCPAQDLLNIAFGVLGPEAVSVTYLLNGHTVTEPTGPGGAYIAVVPRTSQLCSVTRGGEGCFGGGGEETEDAPPVRSADTIRNRMSSFQRGVREARAAGSQNEEP